MEHYIWLVLTTIGAWFAAYFGSYFRKKGENLASHEDIDKLVDQVRAVTTTTKQIEARISNEVWDRQRQWELKRDALLEGGRAMADFLAALMTLNAVYAVSAESAEAPNPAMGRHESTAIDAFNSASYSFQRAQLVVSVVSSDDMQRAFVAMEKLLKLVSIKVVDGDTKSFALTLPQLKASASDVVRAIRKELGVDTGQTKV
jgi:hypothetical protein